MRTRWHGFATRVQRLFRLVVLFCALRFVVGIAVIAFFDRDALAWGWEVSAIVAATLGVCLAVGLIVLAWAPPYRRHAH